MHESPERARRRRALIPLVPGAVAAILAASLLAPASWAQGGQSDPFGRRSAAPATPPATPVPTSPSTSPTPSPRRAPQPPPAAAAAPVIARVGGRGITEAAFDRIAQPYYQHLREEMGDRFDAEVQRTAAFYVLDELIRIELLGVEAQRQKIQVTPAEIDRFLMRDPFFLTDGKLDSAKFNAYKTNPASNYLQMLPRIREMTAMDKLDQSLRKRFTPTPAQVRAEWAKRNDQVRLKVLSLAIREMSVEPEASEAEWAQYYRAHPDEFLRRTRVRLRYARLPLPAAGDSTRAAVESTALERANAIADSLRRGALPDTARELADSGLFDIPAAYVPGLGRVAGLADTIARIDRDSTIRIVGPYVTPEAVVVGAIAERQPKHVPPMREVLADVKRRADAEKRRLANEAERREFYEAHRERWRGTRVTVTRVTLDPSKIAVNPPRPRDVERWYAQHGRALPGISEGSPAGLPPITDSLRAQARARMTEEDRARKAAEAMSRIAAGLRATRDVRGLAKASGAAAETLGWIKDGVADTLFSAPLMDSLLASASASEGLVQGPRAFGRYWALWRVDAVDTSFVPPYDAVRSQSDRQFLEERQVRDEAAARTYFEQHREDYKTPVRYALDFVAVRMTAADSARIPETEMRRYYDAHASSYRQEEQARARHILLATREVADAVARARADSLRAVIGAGGGDFAELARRFSQDPGTAAGGGELGWFGRGRMVKPFEDAVFALKPGEVSPVVKTPFGYHIIQLEDHRAAGVKPFEEVRGAIRQELARLRADSTARRSAGSLRRRLALGGDAKLLAAPFGGVVSAAPIAATDPVPNMGIAQGLSQDLPGMAPGRWSKDVYRAGDSYLVLRVRERIPPRPAPFDEVRNQALEDMKDAQRRAVLNRKVTEIRDAVAAGASLDSLAAPYGGFRDIGFVRQTSGFVPLVGDEPRVLQKAFAMRPGERTDTLQVALGVVWIQVEERKSGDPASYQAAASEIETELLRKKYDAWVEEKRKTVKVEILRPDLKGPRPSPFKVTLSSGG